MTIKYPSLCYIVTRCVLKVLQCTFKINFLQFSGVSVRNLQAFQVLQNVFMKVKLSVFLTLSLLVATFVVC